MTRRFCSGNALAFGLAIALALPTWALAADGRGPAPKYGEYNPEHKTVELFEAMEAGQIDVKLIPKDSTESQVLIENKGDEPLNIKLPDAFAGVPVLAQLNGNLGGTRTSRNSGSQGYGGGWGGGMNNMMGGGMWNVAPEQIGENQPAMLNVPPEKVGKLKVTTVCLEHGKAEPRPAIDYTIKPIDQFTDKKDVQELCRMLGSGLLNQRSAQAAAWNLANGMSWQELANKRIEHADGTFEPYFMPQELQAAMQIAGTATNLAKQRETLAEQKNGEPDSLSRR